MQSTVRTFETDNSTYYISYGRTAKTTYEQQQQYNTRVKRLLQKALMIVGLIIVCIIFGFVSTELIIPMTLVCLLGIAAVITDNIALFN